MGAYLHDEGMQSFHSRMKEEGVVYFLTELRWRS